MRLIIGEKNPTEELTGHILFTLVVGYFACAQYDVLFFTRHSERSEESHRRTDGAYTSLFGRGIFRCAQYDVFFLLVIARGRSDRGNPLGKVRSTYFKGKSKFYIDGYLRKCLSENLPRVLYNKRIYFASVLKGLYIITNKTRKLAATPQSA